MSTINIELTDQNGDSQSLEVEFDSEKTVLEHIEAAGATSPYGCRVGSCGTCIATIKSGGELLEEADSLEENTCGRVREEDKQARLPCRVKFKAEADFSVPLVIAKIKIL